MEIPTKECVDHVFADLGCLERESFVNNAVACEFAARGYTVEREVAIPIWFTTSSGTRHRVGVSYADLVVVAGKFKHIVEFKVTGDTASNRAAAEAQPKTYVKHSTDIYCSATLVFYPRAGVAGPSCYSVKI